MTFSSSVKKYVKIRINKLDFFSNECIFWDIYNKYIAYNTEQLIENLNLNIVTMLFPGTFSEIVFKGTGKQEI